MARRKAQTGSASDRPPDGRTGISFGTIVAEGELTPPGRALLLGDRPPTEALGSLLTELGWTVVRAHGPDEVDRDDGFDLVLLSERHGARKKWSALRRRTQERWPTTRLLVMDGTTSRVAPASHRFSQDRARGDTPSPRPRHRHLLDGMASGATPGPARVRLPPMEPRFYPHELGFGRIEEGRSLGSPSGRKDERGLRIDAAGAAPRLLARLLVGGYLTGQERVVLTAAPDLTPAQREEVQRTAHRLLGMSVVADESGRMEVLSFLDPTKYEFVPLLERTVWMLRSQIELARRSLEEGHRDLRPEADEVEEGIDRLYLLMVRQLFLSCDSPSVARRIDVPSRHFQIGDRLVAKVLEVIGDLFHDIGHELASHRDEFRALPPELRRDLGDLLRRFDSMLDRTAQAFVHGCPFVANGLLDEIQDRVSVDASLGDGLARQISNPPIAIAAERIVWSVVLSLDLLVILNEVTLNRSVEPIRGGGSGAVPSVSVSSGSSP